MDFVYNPQEYVKQSGSQYGAPKTVNDLLYNRERGFNFLDSTAFAYQQMAKREDNAFNVGLLNYMNEYNTPLEQMKRYQAAGLNPVDALGKTNTSAQIQSASGGSAQAHKTQEMAQYINLGNSIVDGVSQILEKTLSAKESLIKLRYLDMNEYNKANQLRYAPLIAENYWTKSIYDVGSASNKEIAGSLSNLVVGLSILEKLWTDGISPNFDGSDNLSAVLRAYGITDPQIKDTSYYARMANELLDLREANKNYQWAQRWRTLSETEKINWEKSLRSITGIPVIDKIFNYLTK